MIMIEPKDKKGSYGEMVFLYRPKKRPFILHLVRLGTSKSLS